MFTEQVDKEERTDGRRERRTDGRTDGRTEGRTDGRTDGRTSGWNGGRTDGGTDRHYCLRARFFFVVLLSPSIYVRRF